MGCRSVLGDLFYLTDSLLDPHPPPNLLPLTGGERGVSEGLRAQLYNMYGEGQISEEVFTALRALADRGQLRPADLAVHRTRRHPEHQGSAELRNALRGIRSRLAQLAQARSESARVMADLEARLSNLDERIAGKAYAARQAVGHDEDAARQSLSEKAELAASHDRLAAQAQALREDLARLDDLRAQLEARAAELEAVHARGELAGL